MSAVVSALALGLAVRRSAAPVEPVAPVPERSPVRQAPPASPWRLVVGAVVLIFGLVATVYLAFRLWDVITVALVALLLAVGLQGPVARLHRLGIPRPLGLLAVYLAAIVGLVVAGWLLLPPVFRDLRELAVQAPAYLGETQSQLSRFGFQVDIPGIEDVERRVFAEVSGDLGSYLRRAVSILSFTFGLLGGVLSTLLVLVLSIFMVTEGPAFRRHVLSLLPPEREAQWGAITQKIAVKIQGWMIGTLFLGIVLFAVTTLSLLLMGMPYAFLLGLLAGIGEMIPMIGPILAAVPAVVIAAFNGWGFFFGVLALYIVLQQLENYLLVPRIMGRAVELPSLVVLIAFLVGSELAGVLGAILATPVAAVLQVLWVDWIVPGLRARRDASSTPAMP